MFPRRFLDNPMDFRWLFSVHAINKRILTSNYFQKSLGLSILSLGDIISLYFTNFWLYLVSYMLWLVEYMNWSYWQFFDFVAVVLLVSVELQCLLCLGRFRFYSISDMLWSVVCVNWSYLLVCSSHKVDCRHWTVCALILLLLSVSAVLLWWSCGAFYLLELIRFGWW